MHWNTNTHRWRPGNCCVRDMSLQHSPSLALSRTHRKFKGGFHSMVIGTIRIRIDHPRSLRSWYIKWVNQSFPRVDSSVPLMWCLSRSFQWNTHRFVLLCRHLIDCFWRRILSVYCLLSTATCLASTILTGLSPKVCPSVLVRKTIWVTSFRLFFWFCIPSVLVGCQQVQRFSGLSKEEAWYLGSKPIWFGMQY